MPIKISQKTKAQVEQLLVKYNDLVSQYHNDEKSVDFEPIVSQVNYAGIVPFAEIKKEPEYKDIEVLEGFRGAYENILKQSNTSAQASDEGLTQLTLEKYVDLYVEYKIYTNVTRLKNVRDIKTAREFGDLSENAEYQIAREQQGLIEARITELKVITDNCVIVDPKDGYTVGEPGATVTIKNLKTKQVKTFELVGATERDINSNPPKISNAAPLGKAVLGKKKGDQVRVMIGKNKDMYEITEIK